MSKIINQFPVMVGCKLSFADADRLEDLVRATGLKKGVLVREVLRRVRVEDLTAVAPASDEVAMLEVS